MTATALKPYCTGGSSEGERSSECGSCAATEDVRDDKERKWGAEPPGECDEATMEATEDGGEKRILKGSGVGDEGNSEHDVYLRPS